MPASDDFADFVRRVRAGDQQAAALGGPHDGRRMQLTRALDGVARQVGLDEGDGDCFGDEP